MTLSRSEQEAGRIYREAKKRERKAAKRARPKSEKATRGRAIDKAYLAWLRRQPCALSRHPEAFCKGPTEAAHIRSHLPGERPTGLQRKPDDRRATPLCQWHHWKQHGGAEMRFWYVYGLDPFKVAEEHYQRFRAETDG